MKSVLLKTNCLLLISVLLTSCVTAVVTGAALGLVYDKRGLLTIEDDARIFQTINTAVVRDPQLRDARVSVTSFNRIVLLVGQVPAASLRQVAADIAKQTEGVYRVYNSLTVGPNVSFAQQTKDSVITGQVRSRMLARPGLESGSIRIVTENDVVYLIGIATPTQAALATDVARHVEGVKRVVKLFQYIR